MPDWTSYALGDFLPFSLETYQGLGARYNARFSIAVIIGLTMGVSALVLLHGLAAWRSKLALAGVGLSWLWISWAYQLETLAPLLWAGELFALAFALQSGLLLANAACAEELTPPQASERRQLGRSLGYGMLAFAVVLLPFIELAAGRSWSGLSLFGSAPVPTAIGTLGIVAMLSPQRALTLMPIPALWCLIAGLLHLGLGDPLWLLPALALPIGLVAALLGRQIRLSSHA